MNTVTLRGELSLFLRCWLTREVGSEFYNVFVTSVIISSFAFKGTSSWERVVTQYVSLYSFLNKKKDRIDIDINYRYNTFTHLRIQIITCRKFVGSELLKTIADKFISEIYYRRLHLNSTQNLRDRWRIHLHKNA